ncbi:MAG: hypothetical protein M1820_006435 [Bogoriella megaspora]|nr:MAG: hypothetical protein M1820_006435 [Bogoriella megaspora]
MESLKKSKSMPEREVENMASNNPAMTIPAGLYLAPTQSRSWSQTQRRIKDNGEASNPAGEHGKVQEEPPARLTKFDPIVVFRHNGDGNCFQPPNRHTFPSHLAILASVVFFILNMILFTAAFTASFLRYTLYPEIWTVMIADSTNSLFLGTIPMGFATLVESWVTLCCPYWGSWATTFAWACWIIDSVVAMSVTVSLPTSLMSQSHQQSLDRITAAQLLPIAATIVASGLGARVAGMMPTTDRALATVIISYVMWSMATPLAMTVLVMYYQRLALFELPPREVIVSVFLPLGPLGFGGWTIMYLGKGAGAIAHVLGIFIALIMWGFGLIWFAFALATIYQCRPFPFNMGWWGFTFPLGVYAISTMEFGNEMSSLFFKVLGTILTAAVVLLWIVVAANTARGAWNGRLFYAPCLANLSKEKAGPEKAEEGREKAVEPE